MPASSTNRPITPPARLKPVAVMPPYVQCWCESGKKFKFCHSRREHQKPLNIFEEEQKMLAHFREGYCSHPECHTGGRSKVTDAHTIQRRGGLAAIAEDGHVLTIKPTMRDLIAYEGTPPPRRLGIGKASVFPGFCNEHDSATFRAIEGKDIELNLPSAFLFAYRTIAYERFTKASALRTIDIQREMDRGHSFASQAMLQQFLLDYEGGLRLGMRDIDSWKEAYDARLLSGEWSGFNYYAIRFNGVLPIVGCGAFHPEYDFAGNSLQRLGHTSITYEHLSFTITTFNQQTVAFFGWLGTESGPAGKFVASFRLLPSERKADALIRLSFEQLENIYLRPSWWESLAEAGQSSLLAAVASGTSLAGRSANCLIDRGLAYCVADVIDTSAD